MMTKRQIDLALHALGHMKRGGFRNYYAATPDMEDDLEWAQMVIDGTAKISREPIPSFPYRVYTVTPKGKRQAWAGREPRSYGARDVDRKERGRNPRREHRLVRRVQGENDGRK